MKYKIVNEDKAKKLHLEELDGALKINLAHIPKCMTINEYLNYIKENNIVLVLE